jgi:hypothetical protein
MNTFSNGINYADGDPPTIMPPAIEAGGYDGWYYKNIALGRKINWYIPPGKNATGNSLRIADLRMIFASIKVINPVSLPFITVYTNPTGLGDAASWYHSRTTYIVWSPVTAGEYCIWAEVGATSAAPTITGHTNIKLTLDTFSSRGTPQQTNTILAVAFSSNSSSAAGNVEFILSDIELVRVAGDPVTFVLSNDELFTTLRMNFNSLTVSATDTRAPGNIPAFRAFAPANSVTNFTKIGNQKINIGHNALTSDDIVDNLKMPRLANVAGKADSSVAADNTGTIFNHFFASVDFKVLGSTAGTQCTVEAWGEDATTSTKIYADNSGNIKVQYSGVDLVSKGFVAAGDEIGTGTYGWTTRDYPGSLVVGQWYRLTQAIQFSESAYGDQVRVCLYELTGEDGAESGAALWNIVDNTWEAYYLLDNQQVSLAPSVDTIQFQCSGSPINLDVLTVKNLVYATKRSSGIESVGELSSTYMGNVQYYGGNSLSDVISAVPIDGSVYAFSGTGGFQMERGFADIRLRDQDQVQRFDATNAVQVKFDRGVFNAKLGQFSNVSDVFANDSLTLSAAEFVAGMTLENVISVGKYETLYSDFVSYVRTYFGYNGGFESLFNAASEFEINSGVFDAAAFMNLITGDAETRISDLSGSITVSNINKLLRFAVDSNCFGNRDPAVSNFGTNDGFVVGDLIWVPNGTTIQLNLDIDAESFAPINNRGPIYAADIEISQDTAFTTGNFSETTHSTTTNINRILEAPLLIRLI